MKINELTGIKNIVKKNYDFKIPGADKLGVGNGGQVFGIKNKPYVIKITRFDLGYLNWVKFCQNYSGEYKRLLPRFGKVMNVKDMYGERINIIQMEKLKPYVGKEFLIRFQQKQAVKTILKYSKEYPSIGINNIDDFYNMLKDYGKFFNKVDSLFNKKIKEDLANAIKSILPIVDLYDNLSNNNKLLVKFILSEFIFKDIPNEGINFIGDGTKLDIHEENLMMRENGEVVLTDPWYNISSSLIDIGVIAKLIRQGKKEKFNENIINELTGIKNKIDDFQNEITKIGFKLMGIGAMGVVFKHPLKPYVLKIFLKEDYAYNNFLQFIKNKNSEYLPKIGKVFSLNDNYNVIQMELLEYNNPNKVKILGEISRFTNLIKANNSMNFDETLELYQSIAKIDMSYYDDLFELIYELYKNNKNDRWDLHGGNLMFRGDLPVIIDPYFKVYSDNIPLIKGKKVIF